MLKNALKTLAVKFEFARRTSALPTSSLRLVESQNS